MDYQKGSVATNILIGFESEDIFQLFDSDSEDFGDITNLVAGNPNLFLFGYSSPRNLIEMVHSYGANGKSGGGASTFNIKFIDPEVEFENRFLKHSSMQAAGIAAFSVDPDDLKTKADIKGSPYRTWWTEKFGEKYAEARQAEDAVLNRVSVAWAPTAGGETAYSGRHRYLTGDKPGNPSGPKLADGMYQELMNFSAYSNGEKSRWSTPAKLGYRATRPSEAPHRYYHRIEDIPLDQKEEIEEEALAEVRQAITDQQEALKTGATTKIFIAYGQGYDFNSWAGPFVTTMMDATNEYDAKGVRSLSIQLVANTGSFGSAAREGALGASFGKKVKIRHEIGIEDFNAFGQGEIEEMSSDQVQRVVDMYRAEYGDSYGAAWLEKHSGTELSWGSDDEGVRPYRFLDNHVPGDLHAIIRAMITKYLCATTSQNKIPMGNMVVLLPDLTKGLESVQGKILTDVLTSNSVRALNEGKSWDDLGNSLWNNGQVDTDGEVEQVQMINSQMMGGVNMQTVWGFQVVKQLVELLGFEFAITTRYLDETVVNADSVETTQRYLEGLSFSAYKEFDPYDDWGWDDKNTTWSDSLLHFFGEIPSPPGEPPTGKSKKKFELILTNRYDENFEETLYRCLSDISSKSNITFSPNVIWETDTQILKMLKEYGVIETDQQPAVICGDKALIDQFVYGGIEFQTVFKQEGAVSNFLKHVHIADEERFSWSKGHAAILHNAGMNTADGTAKLGGFTEGAGKFPYCEAIFSKLYNISYGAFDRLYQPHSESAFEDVQKLTAAGIPIFRSGHKNSNILSMKCDLKPYYFAGLFTNFLAERGRPQQRGSGRIVSADAAKARNIDIVQKSGLSEKDKEELIALYTNNLTATEEALNTLNSITEEEFGFKIQTQEDYRDYMNFALGITAGESTATDSNGNPIELVIPSDGPRNSFLAVKDMIDTISKQSLEVTIKTLPYFRLSGIHALARPVIMNIREAEMAATPYADDYSASAANAISTKLYSGFWNLYGFKHTITNKQSFSEFTLFKQPGETDPNYGKIDEISNEMMEASIEASLETGGEGIYDLKQSATATSQGGSAVENLKDDVQRLNQPPYNDAGDMTQEG